MRSRALSLYEETGKHLGVKPYVKGSLAGSVPVAAPAGAGAAAGMNVNMNFDLSGLVRQVVINNQNDIDDALNTIADSLRIVFQNMVK